MLPSRLLVLVALGAATSAQATDANKPVMRFVFDPDYSGVAGFIAFNYEGEDQGGAMVEVELRFNRFDMTALKAVDSNCPTDKIPEFTWHIHTAWQQPEDTVSSSTSFAKCAKAITGNHYDPYKICGPASEYADSPACAPKIKDYKCTYDVYQDNFASCEAGDLSGKFGTIKPYGDQAVFEAAWRDPRFPFPSEATDEWNIVLHAVCGKATPRVACARGHFSTASHRIQTKDDADDETVLSVGNARVRVHTHGPNN